MIMEHWKLRQNRRSIIKGLLCHFFSVENIAEIAELLKVCINFKLKAFQLHLVEHFDKNYIDNPYREGDLVLILNLFHKSGFQENVRKMMSKKLYMESLGEFLLPNCLALEKAFRLELLKNSATLFYSRRVGRGIAEKNGLHEIRFIFNFLELIFHENRVADLAVKKEFMEPAPLKAPSVDLDLISCKKDSKNCVTLAIEEEEIHVNSFLLTDNSPVFEAMLNSTFKEGHAKRIELPGKNFADVVYFLQYLSSLRRQSIKGKLDLFFFFGS